MDFITIANQFGIPITFLVALSIAVWRVGVWLGKNVVKPVAERHMAFIDSVVTVQQQQTDTLGKIAATQERLADDLQEVRIHVGLHRPKQGGV